MDNIVEKKIDTPDMIVSKNICDTLVEEGLIRGPARNKIQELIQSGNAKPENWKVEIDLAIGEKVAKDEN